MYNYCFSIGTTISPVGPTAAGSNDFGEITKIDLTFDPGDTLKEVTIPITPDSVVENDETFTVSLTTVHPRVQFSRSTAAVRIDDDDCKYLLPCIQTSPCVPTI